MVREYLELFPKYLQKIPPEQEIEFGNDLLSDTNPISNPPYRMTLNELKELKIQLKDLLYKGFIHLVFFMGCSGHEEEGWVP